MTIYSQLVAFNREVLTRVDEEVRTTMPSARSVESSDVLDLYAQLQRFEERLAFWQDRHWRLRGVDFDAEQRLITHNGTSILLTRREAQLFELMLANPGRRYTTKQLATKAWHDARLSAEQVRTYVVRLRRILTKVGLRATLVTEPGRGYALVFD